MTREFEDVVFEDVVFDNNTCYLQLNYYLHLCLTYYAIMIRDVTIIIEHHILKHHIPELPN